MHWILQDALWLGPPVLESIIAVRLFTKGWWKEYPVFWTYLVAEVVRAAWLFSIGMAPSHYARYFYTYWISECLVCLLGFFVVAEVFRSAFAKRLGLQQWGVGLFRLSMAGLLVIALLVANSAPGNDANKLVAGILVVKRAESFLRLGLIAALFVFVWILGLPWTNQAIGIASGFAAYGVIESAVLLLRSHYGRAANQTWRWAATLADLCQLTLWGATFLHRHESSQYEAAGSAAESSPAEALEEITAALDVVIRR